MDSLTNNDKIMKFREKDRIKMSDLHGYKYKKNRWKNRRKEPVHI